MSENLEVLKFIASNDDTIEFCGLNVELGKKFQDSFGAKQNRITTFDPIMSLASNPDLLSKDFFTKKSGKPCKRQHATFDAEKYTKYFIETKALHLKDSEKNDIQRAGFDAYVYLMNNEEDINALYSKMSDLSNLQKAALHFIELGKPETLDSLELNGFKYVASYDDLILGCVASKPMDKSWDEWIPAVAKLHYETTGRNEIVLGIRPLNDFFDATKYIASYPAVSDTFKNDAGEIDELQATIAYITVGAFSGLVRNSFNPYVYIANYPELIKEDIYVNDEISYAKVAKIWLEKFKDGIDLTKFDPADYIQAMKLDENADAFKEFVDAKVTEYKKLLKKQASWWFKFVSCFTGCFKCSCSLECSPCCCKSCCSKVDTPTEDDDSTEEKPTEEKSTEDKPIEEKPTENDSTVEST